MKILHILDHSLPLQSGYAFRSQSLFQAQQEMGYHPAILTGPKHERSWKGDWAEVETIHGFTHYRTGAVHRNGLLPRPPELLLVQALAGRLEQVVEQERPDVLHAHSPFLNALAGLRAARKGRIPIVYEIRAFWEDAAVDHGTCREGSSRYRLIRAMETRVCHLADHVTVLCRALKQDLIRRGIPRGKITVIPNGIHPEAFKPSPPDETLQKDWNLEGKPVVGFIGSFYRYEGLGLLVRAFAGLARRHRDLVLLLVGGGEMEEPLKRLVRDLDVSFRRSNPMASSLASRVLFPGRISHERIPGVYALMDVLVYPRYAMRLTDLVTPLKPLEAMAMGKPLVASDVGGHRELIEPEVNGVLFPAGDSGSLARAVEALLCSPDRSRSLAERASERAGERFSWTRTTAPYESAYRAAVLRRNGRP